jgi:methyl halide transferase
MSDGADIREEKASKMWEEMWSGGLNIGDRFDVGFVSPALRREIDENRIPKGTAFVPGCGRGYDVLALAAPDRKATGLELSTTAYQAAHDYFQANKHLSKCPENVEFRSGNFFDEESSYDFVYDYTFLCALAPVIREDWAKQMSKLVKKGGILMTLIFPINDERPLDQGPPFPVTLSLLENLLIPVGFEKLQLEMLPSNLSHPNRDGQPGGRIQAASGIGRWKRV